MVHPEVPCVLFCPICPHSLTSRPLVFPEHIQLRIQVESTAGAGLPKTNAFRTAVTPIALSMALQAVDRRHSEMSS